MSPIEQAVLYPLNDSERAPVLAATREWLEKAVIGLNLCPFAKSVYVKNQVRYAISAARTADELLAELSAELALLEATDPKQLDTTLLYLVSPASECVTGAVIRVDDGQSSTVRLRK